MYQQLEQENVFWHWHLAEKENLSANILYDQSLNHKCQQFSLKKIDR